VKRPVVLRSQSDGADERGVFKEAAVRDRLVDAGNVHADDAACAEIEMADLGVAHLAVRKTDKVVAGVNEGAGKLFDKAVVDRLARKRDGIAMSIGTVTPPVEDSKDDRFIGHCCCKDNKS